MSWELIYTSAPKGLKPASAGFCTVAMSQGIPPQLVDRLEALSGYRQIFAPQDPQAALNPVVCSHVRISVAGRNYHVLSRVCAAGLDYSQRTNKFAHHLALDANELPAAGPAWLLAAPGFMATAWDQAVRLLPPRGRPPNGVASPAVFHRWQQATGDAGWGGALIDAGMKNPKAIATLIFKPGFDPLPLLAESLALMPAEQRWQATFSTYYTKLPPGVECRWRCVVEGSPEAKTAAGLVIDLCRRLAAPPAGEYAAAARTGRVPIARKPPRPAPATSPNDLELAQLLGEPAAPPPVEAGPIPEPTDWPGRLAPTPPSLPTDADSAGGVALPRRFRKKEPAQWPIRIGLSAVAIVLIVGVYMLISTWGGGSPPMAKRTLVVVRGGKPNVVLPKQGAVAPATPPPTSPVAKGNADQQPKPEGDGAKTTAASGTGAPQGGPKTAGGPRAAGGNPPVVHSTAGDGRSAASSVNPPRQSNSHEQSRQETLPDPFSNFRDAAPAGIPIFKPQSAAGGRGARSEQFIAQIVGLDPRDVELRLVGGAKLPPMVAFRLDEGGMDSGGNEKIWSCFYSGDKQPLAAFSLGKDGRLQFRWSELTAEPAKLNMLRYELLEVASEKSSSPVVISLARPAIGQRLRVRTLKGGRDEGIPLQAQYLPTDTTLFLEVIKPATAPSDATINIRKISDDETEISFDCGPKLVLTVGVRLSGGESRAVTASYKKLELDKDSWHRDIPMVKSNEQRLELSQVELRLKKVGAEKLSASELYANVEKTTQEIEITKKNAKTAKGDQQQKLHEEIEKKTKERDSQSEKLAVRRLCDAFNWLLNFGLKYRVYYRVTDVGQQTHKVDLVAMQTDSLNASFAAQAESAQKKESGMR